MRKIKQFIIAIIMAFSLVLMPATQVYAAGCEFPPEMGLGNAKAKEGDIKTDENGKNSKCIDGMWIDTIETRFPPDEDRVWAMAPGVVAVAKSGAWIRADVQEYTAANGVTDPTGRTGGNTWAIFFTDTFEIMDPISGEISYSSYKAVHFQADNLAPGATYYAFATKTLWDPTPHTGWDTQNGEALALSPLYGGGFVTVVAKADGTAHIKALQPPAGYGWNYVRLVTAGGGGGGNCSAPVATP